MSVKALEARFSAFTYRLFGPYVCFVFALLSAGLWYLRPTESFHVFAFGFWLGMYGGQRVSEWRRIS